MYIEQREALEHQMNILEHLAKDINKAQKECANKNKKIVAKISKIPCSFLDKNEKVLDVYAIIKEFNLLITTEVDMEDFNLSSIDKLLDLHFILDFLDSLLKKQKKSCIDQGQSHHQ